MTYVWIPARNFTPTPGRQIDLIVIHDMEAPEGPLTAENVANWFAGPNAPRASAHRCFDNNSNVNCVRDEDVAWHAPGANHNSLGYEHAGYARQSREEWFDDYSRAMLDISAEQARIDCATYGIPVVFVDAAGLQRGERGITTHWEVTQAFRRSTHTDPGTGFPMDHYLHLVAGLTPEPAPPLPPSTDSGDQGMDSIYFDDWLHVFSVRDDGALIERFGPIHSPSGSAEVMPPGWCRAGAGARVTITAEPGGGGYAVAALRELGDIANVAYWNGDSWTLNGWSS